MSLSVKGLLMELCQRTLIPFSKLQIKIEKGFQSQVENIIVIKAPNGLGWAQESQSMGYQTLAQPSSPMGHPYN